MTEDSTGDERLLLGWCGWPHADWLTSYFPEDLPEDWQLAYFSNDADALFLSHAQWRALDVDEIERSLEDLPPHFRFYLQASVADLTQPLPGRLGQHLGGLMVESVPDNAADWPFYCQLSPTQWVAVKGESRVVCAPASADLRVQRTLFESLHSATGVVLFSGNGADPSGLADLRTLAELLGS